MRVRRYAVIAAVATTLLSACAEPVPARSAPAGSAAPSAPAAGGGGLSESKPMLGLDLKPMGPWTPTWDAESKVAKWENKDIFFAIKVKIHNRSKIDSIEDLKREGPMMSEIGSAITKVLSGPKTTPKGWHALVEHNEGKSQVFVYFQKIGDKTLLCSTTVKTDAGVDGVPLETALAACESIKLKP